MQDDGFEVDGSDDVHEGSIRTVSGDDASRSIPHAAEANQAFIPPPSAPKRLTMCTKLGYGIGEGAIAMSTVVLSFFLNPFLLQVAGVPAYWCGTMVLVGRVWDAIFYPLCGRWVDLTNTKWGRKKPWMLGACIPFGLSYFAMWQVPPVRKEIKYAYYLVVYILLYSFGTCFYIPFTSLTPDLARGKQERIVALTKYRMLFSVVFITLGTGIQGGLVNILKGDPKQPYFFGATGIGVLCMGLILAPIFAVREPTPKRRQQSGPTFFEGLKITLSNRTFVILTIMYTASWSAVTFLSNNLVLFVGFVLRKSQYLTYILLCAQTSTFMGIIMWSSLMQRIPKRTITYSAVAIGLVLQSMFYFVKEGQYVEMLVLASCSGIPLSVAYLMVWLILPIVVDEDERKCGVRREALYYSMIVFFQNLALGAAIAASNYSLAYAGYEAGMNPDQQTINPTTMKHIAFCLRMLMGPVPVFLLLLTGVANFFQDPQLEDHSARSGFSSGRSVNSVPNA